MRFCSRCGDFYADRLLAFCPADGAPLMDVDPGGDTWGEGVRVVDRKAITQRAQNRKLKWKRATLRTMLTATLVVTAAAFSSSISVTVERPRGELCIATFNDLNRNGVQDAGEPGLSGVVFLVNGTDSVTTLTTNPKGGICSELPVGTYTLVESPKPGWIATTSTTQTVTIAGGQSTTRLFGSREESKIEGAKLCLRMFDDQNANGEQDADEPGLSGVVFQVNGTDSATTLTTNRMGGICSDLPAGTYTVVETPMPGWTATTKTTQTVTLTANQSTSLSFGSTKRGRPDAVCSEADNRREWQIIIDRYDAGWRRIIESERGGIIAENAPAGASYPEVRLGPIEDQHLFTKCTLVMATLTYDWVIQSPKQPKTVRREKRFVCEKTGGSWICRPL